MEIDELKKSIDKLAKANPRYEEINQFYEKVKSIRAAADIDADELADAIIELYVNGGLRWHE